MTSIALGLRRDFLTICLFLKFEVYAMQLLLAEGLTRDKRIFIDVIIVTIVLKVF